MTLGFPGNPNWIVPTPPVGDSSHRVADTEFVQGASLGFINVKTYGAVGNNSTDDTTAIQNAVNAANAIASSGTVYFPAGLNCKVTTTITVPNSVRIIGGGANASQVTASGDFVVMDFTGSGGEFDGQLHDMWIIGNQSASAATACVRTAGNAKNIFRDCYIWGGNTGLLSQGVDGYFENCFIAASATSGAHLTSTGANWYIRCKFDDAGFTVQRAAILSGSSSLLESHFAQCDFSGNFTSSSLLIDDSNNTAIIAGFDACVFSGAIVLQHIKAAQFSQCEFGSNSVTVNATAVAIFVGNYAFGATTITGTNVVKAGNFNIT